MNATSGMIARRLHKAVEASAGGLAAEVVADEKRGLAAVALLQEWRMTAYVELRQLNVNVAGFQPRTVSVWLVVAFTEAGRLLTEHQARKARKLEAGLNVESWRETADQLARRGLNADPELRNRAEAQSEYELADERDRRTLRRAGEEG